MERNGSGILPSNTSRARFRSSIFITPDNTSGTWPANCSPTRRLSKNAGWLSIRTRCWMRGRLKIWWPRFVPSFRPIRSCLKRSALRLTTFRKTPSACATPNSARNICSSAQVSSKPAARPSSAPAASSQACSGPCAGRTPSWHCDAAISTAASRTTGRRVARRLDLHFYVAHPVQQLREAFPEAGPYRYVILDRDSKFDATVMTFLKATGLKPKRTSIQSPWQNGTAERWVGSCRREILDHVIAINERHLLRLLRDYVSYYHQDRIHDSLEKDTPYKRATEQKPAASAKVT